MDPKSRAGQPAGLLRRLAALLYDSLLGVGAGHRRDIRHAAAHARRGHPRLDAGSLAHAYHAVCLIVVFTYFGWCWTRSGQTLGMRAWRLELKMSTGRRLGWPGAAVRFLIGAASRCSPCWAPGTCGTRTCCSRGRGRAARATRRSISRGYRSTARAGACRTSPAGRASCESASAPARSRPVKPRSGAPSVPRRRAAG